MNAGSTPVRGHNAHPKLEGVSGLVEHGFLTSPVVLGYGVMVARQILALEVRVRVLLPQLSH